MSDDGHINGSGAVPARGGVVPPPPDAVRDLADGCVRFVKKSLGVKLDYELETLPLLDHYLEQARDAALLKPETAQVVAQVAGAYFGEVVRRRYPSWWRTQGDDPTFWQIELEQVYLAFCPVQLVQDALLRPAEPAPDAPGEPAGEAGDGLTAADDEAATRSAGMARLELDAEDERVIAERLAELPEVSEAEFFALSTRLEVIDIAVDAMRARRMAAGEGELALRPEDYER